MDADWLLVAVFVEGRRSGERIRDDVGLPRWLQHPGRIARTLLNFKCHL